MRNSFSTKSLEVFLRVFQKHPEGGAELEILAHQKRLTSFTKPLLLPFLVIGHHPIDRLRIHLIDQGTDKLITIKHGGANEKGRLTEASLVMLYIRHINKIGVTRFTNLIKSFCKSRVRVNAGLEIGAHIRLLGHGKQNVAAININKKDIAITKDLSEAVEALAIFSMHSTVFTAITSILQLIQMRGAWIVGRVVIGEVAISRSIGQIGGECRLAL